MTAPRQRIRILVVEDEKQLARMASLVLTQRGHEVVDNLALADDPLPDLRDERAARTGQLVEQLDVPFIAGRGMGSNGGCGHDRNLAPKRRREAPRLLGAKVIYLGSI